MQPGDPKNEEVKHSVGLVDSFRDQVWIDGEGRGSART